MQYTPYANMGLAGYNYELLYLDGRKGLKDGVTFPLDENSPPPGGIETNPDEVVAFLEKINELMEYSTILLSTQDDELIVGPELPQQFIDDNMELIRRYAGE